LHFSFSRSIIHPGFLPRSSLFAKIPPPFSKVQVRQVSPSFLRGGALPFSTSRTPLFSFLHRILFERASTKSFLQHLRLKRRLTLENVRTLPPSQLVLPFSKPSFVLSPSRTNPSHTVDVFFFFSPLTPSFSLVDSSFTRIFSFLFLKCTHGTIGTLLCPFPGFFFLHLLREGRSLLKYAPLNFAVLLFFPPLGFFFSPPPTRCISFRALKFFSLPRHIGGTGRLVFVPRQKKDFLPPPPMPNLFGIIARLASSYSRGRRRNKLSLLPLFYSDPPFSFFSGSSDLRTPKCRIFFSFERDTLVPFFFFPT